MEWLKRTNSRHYEGWLPGFWWIEIECLITLLNQILINRKKRDRLT
jgi:hypothetical protein